MDIYELLETRTSLGLINEYGEKESSFTVFDLINEIGEVLTKEEIVSVLDYLIKNYGI